MLTLIMINAPEDKAGMAGALEGISYELGGNAWCGSDGECNCINIHPFFYPSGQYFTRFRGVGQS